MAALPNLARERLSSDPQLVLVGESQKLRNVHDSNLGWDRITPTTVHTFYMGSKTPLKPDNVRSLERRVVGVARRIVDLVTEPRVISFERRRFRLSSRGMEVGGLVFYENLKDLEPPKGEVPTDPEERKIWFAGILEEIRTKDFWEKLDRPTVDPRTRATEVLIYHNPDTAWYAKEYNVGREQGYIEQEDPDLEEIKSHIYPKVLDGLKRGTWPTPYWAAKLDRFRP